MTIPSNYFCNITEELLEKVRNWRNKPRISQNMLTSKHISQEEQHQWFADLQSRSDKKFLVMHQNQRPIASLYFEGVGTKEISWGCYLGEEDIWPGSGLLLEIAALDYAFDVLDGNTLIAEVLAENTVPIRMHLFFGYQEQPAREIEKDGRVQQLRLFEYSKKDWNSNKAEILNRLPKNIQLAASMMTYK